MGRGGCERNDMLAAREMRPAGEAVWTVAMVEYRVIGICVNCVRKEREQYKGHQLSNPFLESQWLDLTNSLE